MMRENELSADSYVLQDLGFCRSVNKNFLLLARKASLKGNAIRRFKTSIGLIVDEVVYSKRRKP
jgi:hypothetical protein